MKRLSVLSTFLAFLLASSLMTSCSHSGKPEPVSAAPIKDRPEWLKEGIVMVGNWEPLTFRIRRGPRLPDEVKQWKLEHSEETVSKLKALGVTLMIANLHKGFGLKAEAQDIEDTRKLVEILHRHGMRGGGYVGSTMMYETFFLEEPEARNWVQVNELGRPTYYNSDQTFRLVACRNNPGYMAFLQKVMRKGVQELKLDLFHFDQMQGWGEPRSCRCEYCQTQFREFLRSRYTDDQLKRRFGFTRLEGVTPPPFDPGAGPLKLVELVNPLMQDWARYRADAVARQYGEFDSYIHKLSPETALAGNPNVHPGRNKGFRDGIDYGLLLQHGDIVWSEEHSYASWTPDRRLVSKIRSFKMVRSMDKSLFVYTGRGYVDPQSPPELLLAETMAYNDMNLGNVGGVSEDGVTLTREAKKYIDFFHAHKKNLAGTKSIADAAVLRAFAAVEFNPSKVLPSTMLAEQTLIQAKIPFDIIFDAHLKDLSKYKVLVLANQDALSDEQVNLVRAFVMNGGGLVATEETSLRDDWRRRRERFGLADLFGLDTPPAAAKSNQAVRRTIGKGRVVYIPRIEPVSLPEATQISYDFPSEYWRLPKNHRVLADAVKWATGEELSAEAEAPEWVTMELAEQKATGTWLLHLVNYNLAKPQSGVPVRVRIPAGYTLLSATVQSPDDGEVQSLTTAVKGGVVSFHVPRLKVYDLILLRLGKSGV
jgi:hypothetical protein